ncbi:MAG: hydrogenase maturation nickel metallochaperone HypA [Nanoarchaeota archaeon]|nr:hydrogenase maturation nickel metallochaperone HypA [Nanoarchaeota archaeon]
MHETIIANDIINAAKKHGKVLKIVVEVGDLAHLPAEEMEATLKKMVKWEVEIKRKKAVVKCNCGFKGEPNIIEHHHDFTLFECPNCKSVPAIIDGQDIVLKSVDVE